jgi:hypothetical protein
MTVSEAASRCAYESVFMPAAVAEAQCLMVLLLRLCQSLSQGPHAGGASAAQAYARAPLLALLPTRWLLTHTPHGCMRRRRQLGRQLRRRQGV